MKYDLKWADYSTVRQAQAVRELHQHSGNATQAAKALGLSRSAFRDLVRASERAAARAGYAPEHGFENPAPPGFHTKFVTRHYRGGQLVEAWARASIDKEHEYELIREAARELADATPRLPVIAKPRDVDLKLINVIPYGDPHWGMFAHPEETLSAPWDLKIAEATFKQYTESVFAAAPPAKEALIIDLGDAFHTDNSTNRTNKSGHALDVDTRWAKIFKLGCKISRFIVDAALKKHETVRMWCVRGNHDDHTAFTLACVLAAAYENNPRVIVDTDWCKFHYHEFGVNLFAATHGDTCKREQLAGIMATDQPDAWGRTRERKWFSGHIHTQTVIESAGTVVESYNTMAPRDAYATNAGFRSKRDLKLETYHQEDGWQGTIVRRVKPL